MVLKKNKENRWKRNAQSLNSKDAGVTLKERVFLSRELYQAIVTECKKELPNEACGFISGLDERCKHVWPAKNINPSPYTFAIDLNEQDRILNKVKRKSEDLLGMYHSHPYGKAVPSEDDIHHAPSQNMYYFILALGRVKTDIKCYKISKDKVKEVAIEIYG